MRDYIEPFKDSCDHCWVKVDKKYWTFDLEQCVVCVDPVCKQKQKVLRDELMSKLVDNMVNGLIKNNTE